MLSRSSRSNFKLRMKERNALEALANKLGLTFIRVFGSALQNLSKARDLDVAIGKNLGLKALSELSGLLEGIFGKSVDIIILSSNLNPVLIREIATESVALYEAPQNGLIDYINKIEPLLAIAEDEILAFPQAQQTEWLRKAYRRLRVA
ncbi:MAG: hypothetical protein AABZ06_01135 [Bdellovibrionota bacterium]